MVVKRKPARKPVKKDTASVVREVMGKEEPVVNNSSKNEFGPPRLARRTRTSFGSYRQKMQLSDEAMAYFKRRQERTRWAVDRGPELQDHVEQGFRFVTRDEVPFRQIGEGDVSQREGVGGSRVTMVVGTHDGGQPMIAYLMAQNEEWWTEDQKVRTKSNIATIDAIREGKVGHVDAGPDSKRPGADKSYQAGVKIDV